jgi:hypothetical protein
MATFKPAKSKTKPKVEVMPQFNYHHSFTPKKSSYAAPTQGLEHIILDNTRTAKVASTFNLNSLTPVGPYLAHRFFGALFKVNNFLNFCLLTMIDRSKCS